MNKKGRSKRNKASNLAGVKESFSLEGAVGEMEDDRSRDTCSQDFPGGQDLRGCVVPNRLTLPAPNQPEQPDRVAKVHARGEVKAAGERKRAHQGDTRGGYNPEKKPSVQRGAA